MYNKTPWPQAQAVPVPTGAPAPGTFVSPAATGSPMVSPAATGNMMVSPAATGNMMVNPAALMSPAATGQLYPLTAQPAVIPPPVTSGSIVTPTGMTFPPMPKEESYVENILRMNLGKVGTFYMTYENNSEWNAKIFKGVIEAAGRDHIIISDPATGRRFLLLTLNLDYVTFDEPINYNLPFGSAAGGLPTR